MSRWISKYSFVAMSLLLSGCASCDEAQVDMTPPDCPAPEDIVRMDCPKPENNLSLTVYKPKDLEQVCQSPCKQFQGTLTLSGDAAYSLEPLAHLEQIGVLNVFNKGIRNLKQLKNLKTLDSLQVRFSALENLEGLEQLQELPNGLVMEDNGRLTSLKGLDNVKYIGGFNTTVANNPNLRTIGSLNKLERTVAAFDISYNDSLVDIDGFRNMNHPQESALGIISNPRLIKLTGLEEIKEIKVLLFRGNSSLSECEIDRVIDALPPVPRVTREDNAPEGTPCPK